MVEYKNNHTTSTKCQYQMAISNPKIWFGGLLIMVIRIIDVIKNVVPKITCSPWNPVAIKKVDPNDESEMLNSACMYSITWRIVKYIPRIHVIISLIKDSFFMLFIIAWCDHVTDTPDLIRIIVLRRGTFIGLNIFTREGGHSCPISIDGLILEWKYAQKKDKKNKTSDTMNRIIPDLSPLVTKCWWKPWSIDSRVVSFHHIYALLHMSIMINKVIKLNVVVKLILAIKVAAHANLALMIGHGLKVTIWNGWNLFFIFRFH